MVSSLQSENSALKMERDQLSSWLQGNKTYYESQIVSLNSQISQLQTWLDQNVSLLNEVTIERDRLAKWLQGNITYYRSQITSLNSQISNLQSQLANANSRLQKIIDAYNSLRDNVNMRWDQSNVKAFITPNDPLVASTVYSITGGWNNPLDWNEYWRDVKALYNWVVNNIDPRYDGLYPMLPDTPFGDLKFLADMWQFPNETLKLGMGDCEDMAILLASMIRNYNGMKYYVEVIIISGAKGAHAAVQIPVSGGKIVILDPAGKYYTRDYWGNIIAKDIDTEINNWLNYWKQDLGSDVRVVRVFSDYIDMKFNNMSEYLTWMYSRTQS
jgi:regulator of replication initiation timing